MSADIGILHRAVEEYVASMSKPEFEGFVAMTRDPEESKPDPAAAETDLDKISGRMFGGGK
ncbi:hypothetical protein [Dietzia cercidiphylli]|uniref:CopG family transcriptional regulator n=1 Tax=Dietzia cercidiphylli TaxID=498199 RepID=A0ABN2IK49_9ACTN|nr:hypothetical protein [Dietzia cercidiphylli]MBB1048635.1 hypothetical protein [Dietzia cercidiphylli]